MEAKYFGKTQSNLIEAMIHARDNNLIVLVSMAPDHGLRGDFGFWTDKPDSLIRSFETIVYQGAKRHSDADLETLAKRYIKHHGYWIEDTGDKE